MNRKLDEELGQHAPAPPDSGIDRVMARHPLSDSLIELIARRFRALSDPTRIRLLDRLRDGEATVQELTVVAEATQQNVSKHLGVLLQAGIVRRRKLGNHAYYSIADPTVFALCEVVCGSLAEQAETLREVVGVRHGDADRRALPDSRRNANARNHLHVETGHEVAVRRRG